MKVESFMTDNGRLGNVFIFIGIVFTIHKQLSFSQLQLLKELSLGVN